MPVYSSLLIGGEVRGFACVRCAASLWQNKNRRLTLRWHFWRHKQELQKHFFRFHQVVTKGQWAPLLLVLQQTLVQKKDKKKTILLWRRWDSCVCFQDVWLIGLWNSTLVLLSLRWPALSCLPCLQKQVYSIQTSGECRGTRVAQVVGPGLQEVKGDQSGDVLASRCTLCWCHQNFCCQNKRRK